MNSEEKRKARKLAQRLIPLGACEHCGNPATDRHHPDHNNALDVVCLCRPCHLKADEVVLREQGKRGAAIRWSGHTMQSNCAFCEKEFTRDRARQTTCSRSCGNRLAIQRKRDAVQQHSPFSQTNKDAA